MTDDPADRPTATNDMTATANAKRKKNRSGRTASVLAFLLLILLLTAMGTYGYLFRLGADVMAEGVTVGRTDVSGLTKAEAARLITESMGGFRLTFRLDDKTYSVEANNVDPNGAPLVRFQVDQAVQKALGFGRDPSFVAATAARFAALLSGHTVSVPFELDRNRLLRLLTSEFGAAVSRAENADIRVSVRADGTPDIAIAKERIGMTIDYSAAVNDAQARLERLSNAIIPLSATREYPTITTAEARSVSGEAEVMMARAPFTIMAKGKKWTVPASAVADWLTVERPEGAGGQVQVGLNPAKASGYLEKKTNAIRIAPKNAVFELLGGKVATFDPSEDGEGLDLPKSIALIGSFLRTGNGPDGQAVEPPLDLPIAPIKPEIDTLASNPYGIKEVIGVGDTNFAGSPTNRRRNIATGAKALDGVLVMPGEEFSTMKTLGTVDATNGYLEELVIKDNKTEPEFGGGLCQIGTTTFRAVLASGLPVTERRNHSYRVPYYERDGSGRNIGPGKDATIYDPSPDFKFKNDTAAAILIRTAIKGNRATFTFWGAKDGRKAEQTDSRVWNIKPPPPKKITETADLPPGVEKCTEKAHEGSDAQFTYTVTYADGTVVKKDFFSRYRPWGEVCLVGIDPNKPQQSEVTVPSADTAGAAGN